MAQQMVMVEIANPLPLAGQIFAVGIASGADTGLVYTTALNVVVALIWSTGVTLTAGQAPKRALTEQICLVSLTASMDPNFLLELVQKKGAEIAVLSPLHH